MEGNNNENNIQLNISESVFKELDTKIQGKLINSVSKNKGKSGMFEVIFGYEEKTSKIYVAFTLAVIELIFCALFKDGAYFKEGLSGIALCLGYIAGVNTK